MKTIIDVSSVIYSGHAGQPNMRMQGFPVGGLRSLFRMIATDLPHTDFALCFDGGDILKKELLPTYKAGRIPDYSVMAQVDAAKEILTGCDIPFYHDPAYEADDFVYSICAALDDLCDTDTVRIKSDDRDLACNVRDNCSLLPVSTNGSCIDYKNFSDRVVRDHTIPYNTILLWKIFHGDSSDHYKGIRVPGLDFESVADNFVETLKPLIGPQGFTDMAYASYEVFEAFIAEYADRISPEDMEALKAQARIVYPYRLDVFTTDKETLLADVSKCGSLCNAERNHMKIFGTGSFDAVRFDFVVGMLGPRGGYKRRFRTYHEDGAEGEALRQYFAMKAKELANGTMAVERYRSKKAIKPETTLLQNMELPI